MLSPETRLAQGVQKMARLSLMAGDVYEDHTGWAVMVKSIDSQNRIHFKTQSNNVTDVIIGDGNMSAEAFLKRFQRKLGHGPTKRLIEKENGEKNVAL
jgi:hypothetical protein